MRYIKKTVKVTNVKAYKVDTDTLTVELAGEFEVVGGIGERLAASRVRREFGKGLTIKVEDSERTYRISLDDFVAHAEVVEPDEVVE